jgi:hypothetical protein
MPARTTAGGWCGARSGWGAYELENFDPRRTSSAQRGQRHDLTYGTPPARFVSHAFCLRPHCERAKPRTAALLAADRQTDRPGIGLSGIGLSGIGLSGIGLSGIGLSGIGLSGIGLSGMVARQTDQPGKGPGLNDEKFVGLILRIGGMNGPKKS